jgi:TonB-dependent receptor
MAGQPPHSVPRTIGCYITEDQYNYFNGVDGFDRLSSTSTTHEHVLPSFNVRMDLTDTWLVRFAASRAISRPDIGNLRNYVNVNPSLPNATNGADPLWVGTVNGANPTGLTVGFSGSAQNPFLAPVVATQYDLAIENYFADVGSFSFTVFYKEFEDYIQFGSYFREFESAGQTRTAEVRGPINGEGANIQGFEVAYQQFFDFLPGWLSGFGVQANYTYIENEGIQTPNLSNVGGEGTTITGQAPDQVTTGALEGLSERAYNIVGMYEKGPLALRLAYSWRSEFNVTAIDCCVARPIWQDDSGYLDGSIRYGINERLEISLQGSNLLNTETVLTQQVTNIEDGGLRLPNAWFQNDRRFVLGLRYKY